MPDHEMTSDPVALTGGRTNKDILRIGGTVRRWPAPNAVFARQWLRDLEQYGFGGAPRFLGLDESGREVLTFIEGSVPTELGMFSAPQFTAAARLLRAFHDATARLSLRGDHAVICHGDASPCNFVFQAGVPVALIDFDTARPGQHRTDVGYAAWLWLDLGNPDLAASDQGARLGAFVRSYGALSLSDAVPAVLDAQRELASRPGAPPGVWGWATGCREWTERHVIDLQRSSAGDAGRSEDRPLGSME